MSLYIGIDWSENKHDIVFMNDAGANIAQLTIDHTPAGFERIDNTRQDLEITLADCIVGLETAHNILIDFLWSRGYVQVYVIPPNVTKGSRGRYGSSGSRTDQTDARLLADLLRTDRQRLYPWQPDSMLTRQLRAKSSLLLYLSRNRLRLSNRLRAVLLQYYPAAWRLFSKLTSQIALEFIQAYPTPQAAARLTVDEFKAFARQHGYNRRKRFASLVAHLRQPYPEASAETVQVYKTEAALLASLLLQVVQVRSRVQKELTLLFREHPDRPVFESLPGAGEFLAPALLAKFGDQRERFPTAASVQALAGTCPVTAASGKRKVIKFRRSCDREFRYIAQQWAIYSVNQSVWASAYYYRKRQQGLSRPHAHRCLANRWLAIVWKLWQTQQPYDEAYHLRQRAQRSKRLS